MQLFELTHGQQRRRRRKRRRRKRMRGGRRGRVWSTRRRWWGGRKKQQQGHRKKKRRGLPSSGAKKKVQFLSARSEWSGERSVSRGGGLLAQWGRSSSGAFIPQVVSKSTAIPRHVQNGSGDNSLCEQEVKEIRRKVLLNYNPCRMNSHKKKHRGAKKIPRMLLPARPGDDAGFMESLQSCCCWRLRRSADWLLARVASSESCWQNACNFKN